MKEEMRMKEGKKRVTMKGSNKDVRKTQGRRK